LGADEVGGGTASESDAVCSPLILVPLLAVLVFGVGAVIFGLIE
jgi:hypothetical protein